MRQDIAPSTGSAPYQLPSIGLPPPHPSARQQAASVRHNRSMPVKIPVAHDFICEWCWIGLHQIRRLKQEFGIEVEWLAFEEFPEGLGWPEPVERREQPADRPSTPSRLEYALAAAAVEITAVDRPGKIITHAAHEAVEYAKAEGVADDLVDRIYNAYWRHGLDISDPRVLAVLARGLVKDVF